ncbi:T9SS type A sorting domain-containing protein [Flammeovirga yaeyamensis]|uniref:T9SS type A sorting domain-containing protein n=1 Tax=Flammeovirga yaeyamensis TaxID=367791 RepID=A0AAX1NBF8_9BACT|nr:T9SS type A sorting domain-containing protein [Flammeovirga yaeyamensis]MBB3697288.1 hypothetical protein [Flammeovirga yaeyamensis]NMF33945.1 T9SS type A sorting domain-containing protein [Flammeovirga yaeyamensis]QWG04795.1 T9SS type A sorting domain-containing protein [Flammeovirga yaeyamensis]
MKKYFPLISFVFLFLFSCSSSEDDDFLDFKEAEGDLLTVTQDQTWSNDRYKDLSNVEIHVLNNAVLKVAVNGLQWKGVKVTVEDHSQLLFLNTERGTFDKDEEDNYFYIKDNSLLSFYESEIKHTHIYLSGCSYLEFANGSEILKEDEIVMDDCSQMIINTDISEWDQIDDDQISCSGTCIGPNASFSDAAEEDFPCDVNNSTEECNIDLPVEMIYFNAEINGDKVDLAWSTATELNNKEFIVQRSFDNSSWDDLGKVAGAGNSNVPLKYSYQDDLPDFNGVIYYRLQQVDFDGKYAFHGPITIHNGESTTALTVYPNPVNSGEYLNISNNGNEIMNIKLYTSAGQTLLDIQTEGYTKIPMIYGTGLILTEIKIGSQTFTEKVIVK